MKVRMPSSYAASSTAMIALRSWKRIDCARAFSSDMWFTPKNWLSPNSTRSILQPSLAEHAVEQAPLGLRLGGGHTAHLRHGTTGLRQDHGDHAVGLQRRAEGVLAVEP